MPIYRVAHSHDAIILPRNVVQDTRLSYTARGLLAHLYALPEAWTNDLRDLITPHEDRAAIVAALKELVRAGYLDTEDEATAPGGAR